MRLAHLSPKSWFRTTTSRIVAAIVLTAFVVLGIVGGIAFYKVNQGFDVFLQRQGYGQGAGQGINRLQREQEVIDEFKAALVNSLLIASAAGGMIALILGLLVARQIASPLKKLETVIEKVRRNNYRIKAEVFGPDDIQSLISEFNDLITELSRIESLREELVSDVAHELKTPLTKIKGQLEGIIDGVYEPSNERISTVVQNVDQLEFLIERLQDLSQLKAGKIQLHRTTLQLGKLVRSVAAGFRKEGVSLNIAIPAELRIMADEKRLQSILDNLISNAVKYTDQGEITVQADQHTLTVSDTGRGIPVEHLPYLFERFYRVDPSRDRQTGGMGLGLAIVKETVEAHGWKITIESQPGQGTVCRITFD